MIQRDKRIWKNKRNRDFGEEGFSKRVENLFICLIELDWI